MAIGGVYLLSGSEGGTLNSTGLALALTTVLTYASYIVGINKSSVSDMDGLKLTFYVLLSGAFIFLLNLIVNREMLTPIPSWEIGVDLILLALVPTLISDLTLILAVQHVGSTTTAVLGCMEPLTAVIMGVLFLGESCNFIQSIGICIILIAVTTVIIARNPHEIKRVCNLSPNYCINQESSDRWRMGPFSLTTVVFSYLYPINTHTNKKHSTQLFPRESILSYQK